MNDSIHINCIDVPSRHIWMHSEVSDDSNDSGVDYRMATRFIKNIQCLSVASEDPITITMMHPGGCWDYGMAIFDAIRLCRCHTTIIAYACVASMASVILQAANRRILPPHSSVMIHAGELSLGGHFTAVQSGMEHYQRSMARKMREIYTNRCRSSEYYKGWTPRQVSKVIDGWMQEKLDVYFTAQEAVKYGFADEILTKRTKLCH